MLKYLKKKKQNFSDRNPLAIPAKWVETARLETVPNNCLAEIIEFRMFIFVMASMRTCSRAGL